MQSEQYQAGRNATSSLERSSPSSGPPCCGTGCAVCVLDYWNPDEQDDFDIQFENRARKATDANSDHGHERRPRNITIEPMQSDPYPNTPADLPTCCGTGCAVCVLDYPESFSKQKTESETMLLLEAIEQAQWQARQIIGEQDGDSRQA